MIINKKTNTCSLCKNNLYHRSTKCQIIKFNINRIYLFCEVNKIFVNHQMKINEIKYDKD